jgi:hypothetical protein
VPKDPFIRDKFTREHTAARKLAEEYFARYPKDRYQTEVIAAIGRHPKPSTTADIRRTRWKCPLCGSQHRTSTTSFDNLVGSGNT